MGCENCEHAPTTYEEYCMSFAHPEQYCSDAYSSNAVHCNNYNKERGNMTSIELIIRIPEEKYMEYKRIGDNRDVLFEAIRKGIPLPKWHGRIADMDAAIKCIEEIEGADAIRAIGLIEWACGKRTIVEANKAKSEE